MGLCLAIGPRRFILRGHVTTWFARAYANGLAANPLIIATVIAAASLAAAICYLADRPVATAMRSPNASDAAQRFVLSDLLRFGTATGSCWCYACFGMRSSLHSAATFSIKILSACRTGSTLATAGHE